jgi:hypothetical protein
MAVRSVKKPQAQPQQPEQSRPELSRDDQERIREAAYYRAQQRGFSPGYEIEDWLAAEAQIRNGAGRAP